MSSSLWPCGLQPARLLCRWDSPGKNTGAGCHVLLQGIFPSQGCNPHLLYLLRGQAGPLPLVPPGKHVLLEFFHNIDTRNRPFQQVNCANHRLTAFQFHPSEPVKLLSLCPTLCNPMGRSLPGSCIHGIFQARIPAWVAIPLFQRIFPTQGSNLGLLHYR